MYYVYIIMYYVYMYYVYIIMYYVYIIMYYVLISIQWCCKRFVAITSTLLCFIKKYFNQCWFTLVATIQFNSIQKLNLKMVSQ